MLVEKDTLRFFWKEAKDVHLHRYMYIYIYVFMLCTCLYVYANHDLSQRFTKALTRKVGKCLTADHFTIILLTHICIPY